ncbi:hypothetical protein ACFFLM_04975 [Deinococcus oregonensis]|uniref:Uncharacterized protein n=1 Tax=Deinococcus oregonensis TaxID=1805970 RepID=A0ABV6AXJ3_9DEIO
MDPKAPFLSGSELLQRILQLVVLGGLGDFLLPMGPVWLKPLVMLAAVLGALSVPVGVVHRSSAQRAVSVSLETEDQQVVLEAPQED